MWIITSPYFWIFGLFLALVYPYHQSNKGTKENIAVFCLVLIVLFFGLRGDIGDDYAVYRDIYGRVSFRDVFTYGPGFTFISLLLKFLCVPFHGFLGFCSFVTNILLFRFLQKAHCNLPFALAVFFAKWGIINEANFIRNMFGIVLFLNSLEYIQKRNFLKFSLLNLIGLSFHVSSLLYVPFYWILYRRLPHMVYVAVFEVAMLFFLIRPGFLDIIPLHFDCKQSFWSSHLCEYITSFKQHRSTFLFWSESFLTGVVVCCFYKKLTADRFSLIVVNSFLVNSLFFGLFSAYWMLASRLANLFGFCYWLLYPTFILKLIKNNVCRFLAFIIMLFFMFCRLENIASLPQWNYSIYPF